MGSTFRLADDAVETGKGLAFVNVAGDVLHQIGQRGAEVAETVGEIGIAELTGRDSGIRDSVGAGDHDAYRYRQRLRHRCVSRAEGRCDIGVQDAIERHRGAWRERKRFRDGLADRE